MLTFTGIFLWAIFLFAYPLYGEEGSSSTQKDLSVGLEVYQRSCLWCHGIRGNGDGPAAFFGSAYRAPRPRDFTTGNYKFRSTPSGSLPSDQDLFRVVTQGIPGYMPAFGGLPSDERWAVVSYIKTFLPDWKSGDPIDVQQIASPVPSSSRSIEIGRSLFHKFECHTCHGKDGSGKLDASKQDLFDSEGLPVTFLNLNNRFRFKNGRSAQDIVRTLLTGLDGSPMPSYADQLRGQEQNAWHIANYLLSLSPDTLHP